MLYSGSRYGSCSTVVVDMVHATCIYSGMQIDTQVVIPIKTLVIVLLFVMS